MREFLKRILPERFVWFLCDILVWLKIDKPTLWDISKTERIVEYGWAIKHLPDKGAILDVGCCGTMFPLVMASMGYFVCGIDKKKCNIKHPNFFFSGEEIQSNLRKPDAITLISTIEHIPNDIEYMEGLYKLLPDEGRIIVTAPFGKAAQFAGHRVYDLERIHQLWPDNMYLDFYMKKGNVWVKTALDEAERVEQKPKLSCNCIFCGVFTK